MSETNNGDSKFGFKDKEKALETLQLLESHDMQYRKLTVRGLLGRAKRVLTMTKSEEKLKNISEAIDIFNEWLEQNGGSGGGGGAGAGGGGGGGGDANRNTATDKDEKVETVPGLGFKDKEAAMATLRILEDRDPEYQKLAVKGLIGNSKRVLSSTKNTDKVKSIQEGVNVLEDFLEKFDKENMMRNNRSYLIYSVIEKFPPPQDELALEFLAAYGGSKAKGNYKHLRTMFPSKDDSTSWDIIRNRNITKILEKLEKAEGSSNLFDEDNGKPTELHMELIHWAYSPHADKVKSYAEKCDNGKSAKKRKPQPQEADEDESDESSDDAKKKKEDSD